ncbi:MAG: hypothetical protein DRN25_06985 [Thermoplasmata archaeon]|nr:MAG: hypothetical protein DRN25_06985 [Thermoplasmata archaeon]
MGFSVTATHMILFIAALAIAAGIAGVVSETGDVIEAGIQKKMEITEKMFETDIKIIHVQSDEYTFVYVLNSGKRVINPEKMGVFIDDEWRTFTYQILNRSTNIDNSLFDPGEILVLNTTSLLPGKHKVKVVVQDGVYDVYLFNK